MRIKRFARTAAACLLAPILALALLSACGEDEVTDHGLRSEALASRPDGEAVSVRYGAEDGESYVARIRLDQRVSQRRTGGSEPGEQRAQGAYVLELRQTFERPDPALPLRSRIRMQCVEAEGRNAETYLAREPITGIVEHDADGRPQPHSVRLDGGTPSQQEEFLDMLGLLLFAGYGGSPSWLPPQPVRPGEAWALESFIRPRSVDGATRQARRLGVSAPAPKFGGTARLERVTEGSDGPQLELALDALVEIKGPFSKGDRSGHMSVGDRQRGRAVISARTGLPLSFQMTHTGRKEVRSGGEHVEQEFVVELEGEVVRAGPGGR